MQAEWTAHAERAAAAAALLREQPAGAPLALAKPTSNLFRDRRPAPRHRLDLGRFTHVLQAHANGWVDVEGSTTYEELVAWTLARGVMPAVVPQLKTITVGGAAAGVGIEASSFRHGLVHDTLSEIEVLLPHGDIVVATPENEFADLFFGFPNSYGTLGYALRLRARTVPVKPFVHLRHRPIGDAQRFFDAMADACGGDADFVEGVVFAPGRHVLSTGHFTARAPWRSDYTSHAIYWRSLLAREEDYLSAADYLWRWDTDWFWCSRNFGAQHPLVRRLFGPKRLNSRTYTRWMRQASRWRLAQRWAALRGLYRESVIQDVDIPLARAAEFLDFLQREIGIAPVWVCPVRGEVDGRRFPLYPLGKASLYVNFGFWDAVLSQEALAPGYFNRKIEREVLRLGGIKSLYADSCFSRETFAAAYGGKAYEALKRKYDPQGRSPHLYDKCVRAL